MANGKFKTRKSTQVSTLSGDKLGTKVIGVVNSDMVAFVWNDPSQVKIVAKEMARVITAHAHFDAVRPAIPEQDE